MNESNSSLAPTLNTPNPLKGNFIGFLAILIAAVTPTISFSIKGLPPIESSTFIFFFSFLFHYVWRYCATTLTLTQPINLLWIELLVGFLGICGCQFLYLFAFQFLPPEEVEILYYLWPFMAFILAPLCSHETLRWPKIMASLVAIASLMIVKNGDGSLPTLLSLGTLLALSSAFFWAIYALFTRTHHFQNHFHKIFLLGALVSLLLHLTFESFILPNGSEWLSLLINGIISNGVNLLMWAYGMKRGNFYLLAFLVYLTPLLSLVPLILIGATSLTPPLLYAFTTILICSIISQMMEKKTISFTPSEAKGFR